MVTTAGADAIEVAAVLLAGSSCVWAAAHTTGRVRLAWGLLSASAAASALGTATLVPYAAAGLAAPYPGWADIGLATAVPFAVAAIRAFSSEPSTGFSRWRVWLDAGIILTALTFTAWALGLKTVWEDGHHSGLVRALDLVYPIGDLLLGTALILAIRRDTRRRAVRVLAVLGGAIALNAVNSALATVSHISLLGAGWFSVYLVVALAAVWPRREHVAPVANPAVDLWQLSLPWFTVSAAGLSAWYVLLSGHELDRFLTFLAGAGLVMLTVTMSSATIKPSSERSFSPWPYALWASAGIQFSAPLVTRASTSSNGRAIST